MYPYLLYRHSHPHCGLSLHPTYLALFLGEVEYLRRVLSCHRLRTLLYFYTLSLYSCGCGWRLVLLSGRVAK